MDESMTRSGIEGIISSKIGKHLLQLVIDYSLPERIVYQSTTKWYKQYYNFIDEIHYISFYYSICNCRRFRCRLGKEMMSYMQISNDILKSHDFFVDMTRFLYINTIFEFKEMSRFDEKNGILDFTV
jgi:hypothetical protein